jgi:hypothetical protein
LEGAINRHKRRKDLLQKSDELDSLSYLIILPNELSTGPRSDSVTERSRGSASSKPLKNPLEISWLASSERAEPLPYARGVTDSADGTLRSLRARATALKLTER